MKNKTVMIVLCLAVLVLCASFFYINKTKEAPPAYDEIYNFELHININNKRYIYDYWRDVSTADGAASVHELVLFPDSVDDGERSIVDILSSISDVAPELLPSELGKEVLISQASASPDGMDEYICYTFSDENVYENYLSLDDNQALKDGLYAYFMRNIYDKDSTYGQPFVPEKLPEIYSGAQLSDDRGYYWHIYTRIDKHKNLFWGGISSDNWLRRTIFADPYYSSHTAVVENDCAPQLAALINELIEEDSPSLFFDKGSIDNTIYNNVDIGETVILVEEVPNSSGELCTLRIKLDTEKNREMAEWLMHTVDYYISLAEQEAVAG